MCLFIGTIEQQRVVYQYIEKQSDTDQTDGSADELPPVVYIESQRDEEPKPNCNEAYPWHLRMRVDAISFTSATIAPVIPDLDRWK